MKKKKQTDAEIMKQRSASYGPVASQMETIGMIQGELFKCCMERNGGDPTRKALGHLAALNQGVVKMVRSVSSRDHRDNYQDLRNFATIAEDLQENESR